MLPLDWRERFKDIPARGNILRVSPETFMELLSHRSDALLLEAEVVSVLFKTEFSYLVTYKGIGFLTRVDIPLQLPDNVEILKVESILTPSRQACIPGDIFF